MKALSIVLVDDNVDFLDCVQEFFPQRRDVKIAGRFRSARDALVRLEEIKPDLVLMDPVMPDLNGFQSTLHMGTLPHPPFVGVLTMFSTADYRLAAQAAGADELTSEWDSRRRLLWVLHTLWSRTRSPCRESEGSLREPFFSC